MTSSTWSCIRKGVCLVEQPVEYQPDGEPVVQLWGRASALHSQRRLLGRSSILNDRPDPAGPNESSGLRREGQTT